MDTSSHERDKVAGAAAKALAIHQVVANSQSLAVASLAAAGSNREDYSRSKSIMETGIHQNKNKNGSLARGTTSESASHGNTEAVSICQCVASFTSNERHASSHFNQSRNVDDKASMLSPQKADGETQSISPVVARNEPPETVLWSTQQPLYQALANTSHGSTTSDYPFAKVKKQQNNRQKEFEAGGMTQPIPLLGARYQQPDTVPWITQQSTYPSLANSSQCSSAGDDPFAMCKNQQNRRQEELVSSLFLRAPNRPLPNFIEKGSPTSYHSVMARKPSADSKLDRESKRNFLAKPLSLTSNSGKDNNVQFKTSRGSLMMAEDNQAAGLTASSAASSPPGVSLSSQKHSEPPVREICFDLSQSSMAAATTTTSLGTHLSAVEPFSTSDRGATNQRKFVGPACARPLAAPPRLLQTSSHMAIHSTKKQRRQDSSPSSANKKLADKDTRGRHSPQS